MTKFVDIYSNGRLLRSFTCQFVDLTKRIINFYGAVFYLSRREQQINLYGDFEYNIYKDCVIVSTADSSGKNIEIHISWVG